MTPNPSTTTPEMLSGYSGSMYAANPGRTWILDNNTGQFDILKLTGAAHLALHPDLVRYTLFYTGNIRPVNLFCDKIYRSEFSNA